MMLFLKSPPPEWFFTLLPLLLVAWFCFLLYLISYVSGWRTMAAKYRAASDFTGQKWRWQSAALRYFTGYNNCLTIGADPQGLYLEGNWLIRFAHPPLYIPWTEIEGHRRTSLMMVRRVEFVIGHEQQVKLRIRESLAQKLQAAAGSSWPREIIG